jgi:hypothetical protein
MEISFMPKQQLDDGQTRAAKVKREARRNYQRQVAQIRFIRSPIGSLLLLIGLLILLAVAMITNTLFQASNTLKATVSFQEILIAALIAMGILYGGPQSQDSCGAKIRQNSTIRESTYFPV